MRKFKNAVQAWAWRMYWRWIPGNGCHRYRWRELWPL
jgi:hypothetical protein